MCPVQERNARESSGNIRFFERPDPAVNLSSPELAVKTFARTGVRSPTTTESILSSLSYTDVMRNRRKVTI